MRFLTPNAKDIYKAPRALDGDDTQLIGLGIPVVLSTMALIDVRTYNGRKAIKPVEANTLFNMVRSISPAHRIQMN